MARTATAQVITTPRDMSALIEKWEARPYSWSQHSSFKFNKQQWFNKYVLGIESPASIAMIFGNTVGDTLGTPTSMVPKLTYHPKAIKEYELKPKLNGVELIGYCDFYTPEIIHLDENKTSANPKKWTRKSVHQHGQMDMYALMLMLQDNVTPEKLTMALHYIPVDETEDGDLYLATPDIFHSFPTSRTLQQVLAFGNEIHSVRAEMKAYALARS